MPCASGAPPSPVYVDDDFAGFANGQFILDVDPVLAGNQNAYFNVNAFDTIQAGVNAVATGGIVRVTANPPEIPCAEAFRVAAASNSFHVMSRPSARGVTAALALVGLLVGREGCGRGAGGRVDASLVGRAVGVVAVVRIGVAVVRIGVAVVRIGVATGGRADGVGAAIDVVTTGGGATAAGASRWVTYTPRPAAACSS